jgi:hypothetical protein
MIFDHGTGSWALHGSTPSSSNIRRSKSSSRWIGSTASHATVFFRLVALRSQRRPEPTTLSAWHGLAREILAGDADGAACARGLGENFSAGEWSCIFVHLSCIISSFVGSCLSSPREEHARKLRCFTLHSMCASLTLLQAVSGSLRPLWRWLVDASFGARALIN